MLYLVFLKAESSFLGFTWRHMLLTGRPWSNSPGLLPVRVHYVSLSGGLSSVYEPQESAAISNWQSRGKTMAQTILVEYLIEYRSSVLIKLDRGGQQSEWCLWLKCCCFFTPEQKAVVASENVYKLKPWVFIWWKQYYSSVLRLKPRQTAVQEFLLWKTIIHCCRTFQDHRQHFTETPQRPIYSFLVFYISHFPFNDQNIREVRLEVVCLHRKSVCERKITEKVIIVREISNFV